jgi:hypothetical protein
MDLNVGLKYRRALEEKVLNVSFAKCKREREMGFWVIL